MSDFSKPFYLGVIYRYKIITKCLEKVAGASGAAPTHIVSNTPVPLAAKMFKTTVVSGGRKKYILCLPWPENREVA